MATNGIGQIVIDTDDLAAETSYHHGMSDYREHCDAAYVTKLANLVARLAQRIEELENEIAAIQHRQGVHA